MKSLRTLISFAALILTLVYVEKPSSVETKSRVAKAEKKSAPVRAEHDPTPLLALAASVEREKDFLINELGLDQEAYAILVAHEKETNQRLMEAEAYFEGATHPIFAAHKRELIAWHIHWMEGFLGAKNYERFLKVSEDEFEAELVASF